jgi:hypothetical protein
VLSHVERTGSGLAAGLIEFVCDAHETDEDGPTVTPLRVGWGYCLGARDGRHVWRQIDPTTRQSLERYLLPQRLKSNTSA